MVRCSLGVIGVVPAADCTTGCPEVAGDAVGNSEWVCLEADHFPISQCFKELAGVILVAFFFFSEEENTGVSTVFNSIPNQKNYTLEKK